MRLVELVSVYYLMCFSDVKIIYACWKGLSKRTRIRLFFFNIDLKMKLLPLLCDLPLH